ncbi:hypothetical protein L1887_30257 [Cichorium endivia]|nr:hypothetical protein L1887_30257 [Cichorium endivia]
MPIDPDDLDSPLCLSIGTNDSPLCLSMGTFISDDNFNPSLMSPYVLIQVSAVLVERLMGWVCGGPNSALTRSTHDSSFKPQVLSD